MTKLEGNRLVEVSGMWITQIYQRGPHEWILETQSEMMEEPNIEVFSYFDHAYDEMRRRT